MYMLDTLQCTSHEYLLENFSTEGEYGHVSSFRISTVSFNTLPYARTVLKSFIHLRFFLLGNWCSIWNKLDKLKRHQWDNDLSLEKLYICLTLSLIDLKLRLKNAHVIIIFLPNNLEKQYQLSLHRIKYKFERRALWVSCFKYVSWYFHYKTFTFF